MTRRAPWRPPCHTTPEAGLIAREDQDLARLADLARTAARHHARCARPQACAGEAVEGLLEQLEEDRPGTPYRLLLLAIAELAARADVGDTDG